MTLCLPYESREILLYKKERGELISSPLSFSGLVVPAAIRTIPVLIAFPAFLSGETCAVWYRRRRTLHSARSPHERHVGAYLAYSTERVSRTTVTRIWPGYSKLSSIFCAMSLLN